MSTELLDWAYAYLEQDEEIIVPVKKIWNEWQVTHPEQPLAGFTSIVLADERFEEMSGVDQTAGMEWMTPEERDEREREMEEMGYFSGPRLKLKSREITLEHIARTIKKHSDRLEAALQHAHEAMPGELGELEEGPLLDAMELAKQLRQSLRDAGLDPPDDA